MAARKNLLAWASGGQKPLILGIVLALSRPVDFKLLRQALAGMIGARRLSGTCGSKGTTSLTTTKEFWKVCHTDMVAA